MEFHGMPNILDLFDADYRPNREFERTIQPDDPVTLYRDLRDYVLPPEVGKWLSGLPDGFVHQYLASTNNLVDALRTWITGFFGSGKSHLLKVLAHLLCNSPVQDDNGVTIGAAQYLCTRLGFPNIATLIIAQLMGRPLIIQMLGYARSDKAGTPESTISYIILRHLERLLGYSEVPWIAQYERLLKQHNHWPDFCQFVLDTSTSEGVRQEWNAIRNDVYIAHPYLVQGLHKFLPRTFKSEQLAADAMSLAERKKPEPDFVVKRLLAEATAIDPHKGRMVVCLDEVRLYLGKEPDRVTELQAIAEATKTIGQGKVFLIVTGQESPEDVDSRFYQPEAGIGILTDRFPEKFRLSENNIDYVVCQRLLRKSSSGPHIDSLRALIAANRPQLATAACIRNTMQNPGGRFTNTEPADLERYYPLLPYHVILLQEILTRLRTTGPSGGVVGTKERAILIIIRALFGEPTSLLLGAEPIGALVTFDRVYDVLEEELKGIHLNQRDQIVQIEQCGEPDADFLASVAKAVLLVQQAAKRYFRVTDEVVAAVLYPRLGADPNAHRNKVKDALKRLSEAGLRYITDDTELGYRFLTETETRFEKVVAEQDVTEADRFAVLKESAAIALKKKYFRHEYSGRHGRRRFDVGVTLTDGPGKASASLSAGSHLELQVLSPTAADSDPQWADAALVDSTTARARVVWSIKDLGKLAETVERIVRVRKALTDSRLSTTDAKEQEQIEAQRQRVERLAHDDDHPGCLPAQIVQGMSQGTLVWNGDKKDLIGIPVADDVFAETANKAIKSVFTEFDSGSAMVVDSDLNDVLTWTTTRPKCVEKLELMDNTGKALLDRPVLKTVMDRLRQPDHTADDMRTGESLAAQFDGAPFGWDEHVVRAALATLLRAGALIVKEGAVEIRTSTDPKAKEVFSGWNRFKKAVFEYAGELTPEQRQAATRALQSLFARAGEDTFEKIDRALNEELNTRLPQVAELASAAQAVQLPCVGVLGQLRQDLLAIQ
jgi:energy-coupling factor transporter ATP-binding protein EcfA2